MKQRTPNGLRLQVKLLLSMITCLTGVVICVMCVLLPPLGRIDPSVLALVGELMTFSGALLSISTNSKIKELEINERYKEFEEMLHKHVEEEHNK